MTHRQIVQSPRLTVAPQGDLYTQNQMQQCRRVLTTSPRLVEAIGTRMAGKAYAVASGAISILSVAG